MIGRLGALEPAARLFGAAAALFETAGASIWPIDRADYERNLAAVRAGLGEDAFAAAFAAGRAMRPEEAVAEAEASVAELTSAVADPAVGTSGSGSGPPVAAPAIDGRTTELSPRQVEVLRLVAAGRADKEIAAALGISRHTVANHVARILAKLGVDSRAAAAAFAVRHRFA